MNWIVAGVCLVILALALGYIIRAKRRGVKCIGCSHGGKCSGGSESACSGSCSGNCGSCKL